MSRARSRLLPPLVLAAMTALAVGCGGGASPVASATPAAASPSPSAAASAPFASAGPATITIAGFAFEPEELTVARGTEVVWTNDEDSLHTVTSGLPEAPDGRFDSGEIDTGATFPVTFDEPGTYAFFCARHVFMTGRIVVAP